MVEVRPGEFDSMPARSKKVIVVMPAYNAEKTLQRTLDDIPRDWVDEIILVDDRSRGFVSPLVSPARKLAPHPPSLFSPSSRETVPAQSSTDFLTHTLRLYQP